MSWRNINVLLWSNVFYWSHLFGSAVNYSGWYIYRTELRMSTGNGNHVTAHRMADCLKSLGRHHLLALHDIISSVDLPKTLLKYWRVLWEHSMQKRFLNLKGSGAISSCSIVILCRLQRASLWRNSLNVGELIYCRPIHSHSSSTTEIHS